MIARRRRAVADNLTQTTRTQTRLRQTTQAQQPSRSSNLSQEHQAQETGTSEAEELSLIPKAVLYQAHDRIAIAKFTQ